MSKADDDHLKEEIDYDEFLESIKDLIKQAKQNNAVEKVKKKEKKQTKKKK